MIPLSVFLEKLEMELNRNNLEIWFLSASKPRGSIDRKLVNIIQ